MPSLYAWLRRNPRLVDGALALLLIYPGGGRLLVTLPFTLGMVVPIVFRRTYPAAAFAARRHGGMLGFDAEDFLRLVRSTARG